MNKRYYEHTLPIIRGSLSNTYYSTDLAELLPDNLKAYNKLASYALS